MSVGQATRVARDHRGAGASAPVKRAFDLVVAAVLLVAALPLLAMLALAVKLSSPGPALHRGARLGRGGRLFQIYKLRTMVAGAEMLGPGVTYRDDPRVTALGRFLRRSKLDELPQLVNVLRGDMSLVGPRAEDPRYRRFYTGRYRAILDLRPGVTGPAWVALGALHEENLAPGPDWERHYVETSLPRKLALDLDYAERRSLALDLRLLACTVLGLLGLRRRGSGTTAPGAERHPGGARGRGRASLGGAADGTGSRGGDGAAGPQPPGQRDPVSQRLPEEEEVRR